MAHRLAVQFLSDKHVVKVLIVDDSDDARCREVAARIRSERIEVISRERAGKWSAWRLALEEARDFDGLIEVDSDVSIRDTRVLALSIKSHDFVTAYQEIVVPCGGIGRILGIVYRNTHEKLKRLGKFNMGGQVIGMNERTVCAFLERGFFQEPVLADDHVVALAAKVLGLRCTTIDCGLQIRLPSTLREWASYRSRHKGAIKWAEHYVALKTGKASETIEASRLDYSVFLSHFVTSLVESLGPASPFFLAFIFLTSLLPIEDQTMWSRLSGEKS
jgi:hypothetical protein